MQYHLKILRRKILQGMGIVGAAVLLFGCAKPAVVQSESPAQKLAPPAAEARAARMAALARNDAANGSLWVENASSLSEMFINARARRVGDIVTIRIVETSSASNKASTDTDRTTSMNIGLNSFFGLENEGYPASHPFFNPFGTAEGSYESEFEGSGSTVRSGALEAYISARIVQVLPNGNFVIEGNREVRVNNENQIITLTGVVRPRDISGDNVVQSTYIADARISYSGSGVVNDQQRPGWLIRILDNVWPF